MKKTVGERIGQYVKYQRMKKKMTLTELANKSGLTKSFILRLEKKHYDSLKFEAIQNLSKGLEMDLVDFLAKCGLVKKDTRLPTLQFFAKEKYQFPKEAVNELESYVNFLKTKYRSQIADQKKMHKNYWKAKK